MEAMLREEQERIKADLEVFAEKLKHHGVSFIIINNNPVSGS
jgi:hypothetical protein